jgi:hypothetical protein
MTGVRSSAEALVELETADRTACLEKIGGFRRSFGLVNYCRDIVARSAAPPAGASCRSFGRRGEARLVFADDVQGVDDSGDVLGGMVSLFTCCERCPDGVREK